MWLKLLTPVLSGHTTSLWVCHVHLIDMYYESNYPRHSNCIMITSLHSRRERAAPLIVPRLLHQVYVN